MHQKLQIYLKELMSNLLVIYLVFFSREGKKLFQAVSKPEMDKCYPYT